MKHAMLGILFALSLFLVCAIGQSSVVTLPPASRAAALCGALGVDTPCATVEVGRLHGVVTLLADDTQPQLWGTLTVRSRLAYVQDLGTTSELALLMVLAGPSSPYATVWDGIVLDSRAWPTLQALTGAPGAIPVVRSVRPGRIRDASGSVLPTTAVLKITIAMMQLRGGS